MFSISDLPALNASFNFISTVLILTGWYFIRHGAWRQHMACMITAVISSTFFLTGYIVYHVRVGEKSSGYTGWLAAIYFPILATHVLLAFVTLPLDRHARSGFSSPLGSASAHRSLDASNLALRFGYGRVDLLYALQMVSAVKSTIALASWRRVTFALNDLSSALRTANRHSRAHALHLERI